MALLAYNLTVNPVTLAASNPTGTVIPASLHAGIKGPAVNVTSELRSSLTVDPDHGITGGLEVGNYVLLQAQVASASIVLEWTAKPQYKTGVLTIGQFTGAEYSVGPYEEFTTISAALLAASGVGNTAIPATIRIKNGTYAENLTMVNNVKLLADPGNTVTITGKVTSTTPGGDNWASSFHNINFTVPAAGADNLIVIDGASSNRVFEFRNCRFVTQHAASSLILITDAVVEFSDCFLQRQVAGTDLIFLNETAAILKRCTLYCMDASLVLSAAAGNLSCVDCEIIGTLRTTGTGQIFIDGGNYSGGVADPAGEAFDLTSGITFSNCYMASQSDRAHRTFTGAGTIALYNCLMAADFYPPRPPTTFYSDDKTLDLELKAKLTSRMLIEDYTGLLSAAPGTPNTEILYMMNMSAGAIMCNGVVEQFSAQTDTVLLGLGHWGRSWKLNGDLLVVADALSVSSSYVAAIVVMNITGTLEMHAVFSDEIAGAIGTDVTEADVNSALEAAGVYGSGCIVSKINISRNAGVVITMVHSDPAVDDALIQSRSMGTVFTTR